MFRFSFIFYLNKIKYFSVVIVNNNKNCFVTIHFCFVFNNLSNHEDQSQEINLSCLSWINSNVGFICFDWVDDLNSSLSSLLSESFFAFSIYPLFILIFLIQSSKVLAKHELLKVPLIGWTWYFLEIVFCKRKWEEDRETVFSGLNRLRDYPEYMWVSTMSD